ncbi:MAG: O-antigen ligase family protein [Bacteroidota bacterium]
MSSLHKAAPYLYFAGLTALVAGLPLWLLLISISQIVLLLAWFCDGNIKSKIKSAIHHPVFPVIAGIYILHIAGLIFTTDFSYALDDLRIKLPLLILPLVICTMPPLPKNKFDLILKVLLLSTLISTLYSTAVWLGFTHVEVQDIRDISVFISHIRLSLIICMCLVIIIYLLREEKKTMMRTVLYILSAWFIVFLFILQSLTGICILFVFLISFIISEARKNKAVRLFAFLLFPLLIYGSVRLFDFVFIDSIKKVVITPGMLKEKTASGNFYSQNTNLYQTENNNPVWINICDKELESVWNKRSTYNFTGRDAMGQDLRTTLIRFLASKNLYRDSIAVSSLSEDEITAVENGIPNVDYMEGSSVSNRMKQLAWEYRTYYYSGNSSGHSIMQRFEFWKTGYYIFRKFPVTGTGTGDIKKEFVVAYEEIHSSLLEKFRLRAHNEYLTMFITFGIFGGSYFLFAMIYPWFRMHKRNDLLYTCAITILLMSMLMEDTPESQAGATIFAFFNSFFLFYDYGKRDNY